MTGKTQGRREGLLGSLRNFLATLLAVVDTRLDLVSTDLQEYQEHLLSLVILWVVTLFSLGVGVVLAIILLILAFRDTHPFLILGSLAGLFLMIAIATSVLIRRKTQNAPRILEASLSELSKDRQQLGSS